MHTVWVAMAYVAFILAAAVLGACAVGLVASVMVLLRPRPGDSRAAAKRGVLWYGVVPAVIVGCYWVGWRVLRAVGADVWSVAIATLLVAAAWVVVVVLLRRRQTRSNVHISMVVHEANPSPTHGH